MTTKDKIEYLIKETKVKQLGTPLFISFLENNLNIPEKYITKLMYLTKRDWYCRGPQYEFIGENINEGKLYYELCYRLYEKYKSKAKDVCN